MNEPKPITTTAMAQSGMPPTSSSSMEGAETSLASTEKISSHCESSVKVINAC